MITDLIYDVGMHNGNDTAYYLYKGYRVVAIEANPVLAAQGRDRFAAEIAAGRLTLLSCGVSPQEGTAPFWVCEDVSEYSSFVPEAAQQTGKFHALEVPCRTFAGILREHGTPYYLKVDIEAHDKLCMEAIDPRDPPAYVSMEMSDLSGLNILLAKGYGAFKCISQRCHRQIRFDPRAALPTVAVAKAAEEADWEYQIAKTGEKNWVRKPGPDGWSFAFGCSGPFGEATDGVWQTWEEMAFSYLAQRLGHMPTAQRTMNNWFDLHARIQPPETQPVAFDPALRILKIMDELSATLHRPVQMWLFGAGRHTARLLEQKTAWEQAGHKIVGLIDDDARFAGNPVHLELPVWSRQKLADAVESGQAIDGLILSSDTFEDHFWQLTAALRTQGVRVFRLYGA